MEITREWEEDNALIHYPVLYQARFWTILLSVTIFFNVSNFYFIIIRGLHKNS